MSTAARITARTSPAGDAVYIVRFQDPDAEQRDTGFGDDDSWLEESFSSRDEAETFARHLTKVARRQQTSALEGWDGKDSDDRGQGKLPPLLGGERLARERRHLPRGVRTERDLKRSLSVDTHGGDFGQAVAADIGPRPIGYDDPGNSNNSNDDSTSIGTPKDWYKRARWPSVINDSHPVVIAGKTYREEVAYRQEDYYRATERAEAAARTPVDQDFGTSCRKSRGTVDWTPDGLLDLDSLPATTGVYGSRSRPPELQTPSLDEMIEQARREENARLAAEARIARQAVTPCSTPGCPYYSDGRRSKITGEEICQPDYRIERRTGRSPTPEQIRARQWRVSAPITF